MFKDFTQFNAELNQLRMKASRSLDEVEAFGRRVRAALNHASTTAQRYADAYNRVVMFSYDSQGKPTDITPKERLTVPENILSETSATLVSIKDELAKAAASVDAATADIYAVDMQIGALRVRISRQFGLDLSYLGYTNYDPRSLFNVGQDGEGNVLIIDLSKFDTIEKTQFLDMLPCYSGYDESNALTALGWRLKSYEPEGWCNIYLTLSDGLWKWSGNGAMKTFNFQFGDIPVGSSMSDRFKFVLADKELTDVEQMETGYLRPVKQNDTAVYLSSKVISSEAVDGVVDTLKEV